MDEDADATIAEALVVSHLACAVHRVDTRYSTLVFIDTRSTIQDQHALCAEFAQTPPTQTKCTRTRSET